MDHLTRQIMYLEYYTKLYYISLSLNLNNLAIRSGNYLLPILYP